MPERDIPTIDTGAAEQPGRYDLQRLLLDTAFTPTQTIPATVSSISLGDLGKEYTRLVADMETDVHRRERAELFYLGAQSSAVRITGKIKRGDEMSVGFDENEYEYLRDAAGDPVEKATTLHTHNEDYPPSIRDLAQIGSNIAEDEDFSSLVAGAVRNHAVFRGENATTFNTAEEMDKWETAQEDALEQLTRPVILMAFDVRRGAEKRWRDMYGEKPFKQVLIEIYYHFAATLCETNGFRWFLSKRGEETLQEVNYANPL